jgi:hypothetical protein
LNRLGFWSAAAYAVVGFVYALVGAGAMIRVGLDEPIVDPVLAIMEALTLVGAPLILLVMIAVHDHAAPAHKVWTLAALLFATLMVGLTTAVHFVTLTAGRQLGLPGLRWPSVAYALELLSWDVFLGLSLCCAAPAFHGSRLDRAVRSSMMLAGTLCLLGTVGPLVANMRWQLLGVVGYGLVLPVACLLLAMVFRRYSSVGRS